MGSLHFFLCFLTDFLDTPVNLLLYSEKCQGVPFSPICQIHYLCCGPISLDPICPQPNPDGVQPMNVLDVSTANLHTKILDFREFDSSRVLNLRGGILMPIGNSPDILSQAILVGMILAERLGVSKRAV